MTAKDLRVVSQALYGSWTPSALAADLGVSERSVRRWGNSEWPVPDGVWRDVMKLCRNRAAALQKIVSRQTILP
jgi:hypothetical protein